MKTKQIKITNRGHLYRLLQKDIIEVSKDGETWQPARLNDGLIGFHRSNDYIYFNDKDFYTGANLSRPKGGIYNFCINYNQDYKIRVLQPEPVKRQTVTKQSDRIRTARKPTAGKKQLLLSAPVENCTAEKSPEFIPPKSGGDLGVSPPVQDLAPAEAPGLKVVNIALSDIYTDTAAFQGRAETYSQESANRIITAWYGKTFDLRKFDPVRLWLCPDDGKLYILAGHSRTAAFRIIAESDAAFNTIPAIIFEGITKAEAARFALEESNANATKQTDLSFAALIRAKRGAGMPEKEITAWGRVQYGKNYSRFNNYSFLNPDGKAIDLLKTLENSENPDNKSNIEKLCEWTGEARKEFPGLTNSHENEIFNFLLDFSNIKKFKTKTDFLIRLNSIVQTFDFNPDKPINLNRLQYRPEIELNYNSEVRQLETELATAKGTLHTKRTIFLRHGKTGPELAELLEPYDNEVTAITRELLNLKGQKQAVRDGANAQGDLFF